MRAPLPLRKRADYSNHLHSARGSEAWNINSSSRSRAWLIHILQVCSVRLSGIWVWGLKSPNRFTKPRRMLLRSTNSAEEEGGRGGKEKIPRNECLVAPVLVVANCNSTITLRLYSRYRDHTEIPNKDNWSEPWNWPLSVDPRRRKENKLLSLNPVISVSLQL